MKKLFAIIIPCFALFPFLADAQQDATKSAGPAAAVPPLTGTYFGDFTAPRSVPGAFVVKIKSQDGENLVGTAQFTLIRGPCGQLESLTGTVGDDGRVMLKSVGILDCKGSFDMEVTEGGRILRGKIQGTQELWTGFMTKQ